MNARRELALALDTALFGRAALSDEECAKRVRRLAGDLGCTVPHARAILRGAVALTDKHLDQLAAKTLRSAAEDVRRSERRDQERAETRGRPPTMRGVQAALRLVTRLAERCGERDLATNLRRFAQSFVSAGAGA